MINQIVEAITYSRRDNTYERFLSFDPSKVDVVKKLVSAIKAGKTDPDITRDQYLDSLGYELENIFDQVCGFFWDSLEKQMQDVDVDNRTDWKASWTNMLQDKDVVRSATQGVQKFIAEEYREDGSDA